MFADCVLTVDEKVEDLGRGATIRMCNTWTKRGSYVIGRWVSRLL
jgi:hypothetical protein